LIIFFFSSPSGIATVFSSLFFFFSSSVTFFPEIRSIYRGGDGEGKEDISMCLLQADSSEESTGKKSTLLWR
jgi:hypothetical protein